jgi:hypothetical protein
MVTVLCVRKRSIYNEMGLDCYDAERDMRTWSGGNAVVAHPPCAQWGILRGLANVNESEKTLAVECVRLIRQWGGVLEHPAGSLLFQKEISEDRFPRPGIVDPWGGYSICVDQCWFGHLARKKTLLYICGCAERDLPAIPFSLDQVTRVVSTSRKKGPKMKELPKTEREKTPVRMAEWLIEVAEICDKNFKSKQYDSSRINLSSPALPA